MTISAITSTWLRTLMRRKDYVTKLSSITSAGSRAGMTIMTRLSRKPHAVFSRPDATERLARSNITGMSDKSPATGIPAAALEGPAPATRYLLRPTYLQDMQFQPAIPTRLAAVDAQDQPGTCYDIFLREGQPMTHETPPFSADAALRHFRSYFTEPKDVVAHPQLSRDEKLAILREWEQDALRLSTSESEGMGGGEESMLGRVEESIGILERSPR